MAEGKCAVVVTHRLGSAKLAHRVVVVDAGEIVDIGTLCLRYEGYANFVVPYPGKCGIRMKNLTNKTSLGHIHKQWGPWVHLRLLFTDAHFESDKKSDINVCNHCGKCISACPANAINIDSFNGIACSEYQMSQYIGVKDNYYWKCEVCARICPIGNSPLQLKIISNII